jgi:hypothetical protein
MWLGAWVVCDLLAGAIAQGVNVTTYHNDSLRSGWNSAETALMPAVVGGPGFGLLQQVALDAQVDAQPLLVSGLTIAGAVHDVLYVATEGNTVYAIDASSGAILLQRNLGAPAPLPAVCKNPKGAPVGINSTPVIDPASQTLYVIAYVYVDGAPVYYLHALSLTTLADLAAPAVVAASHKLANGKTVYKFSAAMERQRAALLEAGGYIYAAFAGFCENFNTSARGWLLGWNASTLASNGTPQLTNEVPADHAPNDFLMTSIWMSGYGPSSGPNGNVFFVTGNSDPSGSTYDNTGAINLSESVVEWSPASGKVVSYFSPTDTGDDVAALDRKDLDFGAGGVMLLPAQPGSYPQVAVAAGKVGIMYLMNQDNLGGENSGNVLGEYSIGGCWCGSSYFEGPDGVGRVVSSGGTSLNVWMVQTSPATTLVLDSGFTPPTIPAGRHPGFFTSISSNGTAAGSAVIWAVGRPPANSTEVTLYAFDGSSGAQLFSAAAGIWKSASDANIVPTVVNGKVYVASFKKLSIFGIQESGRISSPR